MTTLAELQSQRATFVAAYAQHKITKTQLDSALASNQSQIDALQANQNAAKSTPSAPPAPSPSVSPLPAETLPQQFTDQSGTTWQNTQPEPKQTPPQVIPTASGAIPLKTFEAGAKDPTMQQVVIPVLETAAIVGLAAIPGAAPVVLGGAAIGVGADIGIKSASKSLETGQAQLVLPKSGREVTETALISAGLSLVGAGAVGKVAQAAPQLVASAAGKTATNIGVNAAISGGVSGVASGGDPKAILEGVAFGAVLGAGGEAVGAAAGKVASIPKVSNAIQNVKDVTVGAKFTEIVGVKEVNIQTTKGMETTITRITQPELQTVTLKGNDARFYRENNLGTLQNPKIELAGTQRISTLSKDGAGVLQEITSYNQPVESNRTANPILSAIKGDTYQAGKVKAGELADFLKTPSDFSAVEKVKIEAGLGSIDLNTNGKLSKNTVPVTKLDKVVASNKNAILPVREVSARDYTGVQLRGEVDPKIYADPAKALPNNIAQDIYKELGGGYNQKNYFADPIVTGKGKKPFTPDVPAGESKLNLGTVGDDLKLVKRKSTANDSGTQSIAKQVAKSEGKTEIQLPRSVVGEVKGKTASLQFTVPSVLTESKQNQKNTPDLTLDSSMPQSSLITPNITLSTDTRPTRRTLPSVMPIQYPDTTLDDGPGITPIVVTPSPLVVPDPVVVTPNPVVTPDPVVIIPTPRYTPTTYYTPGTTPNITTDDRTTHITVPDTLPTFTTTPDKITAPTLVPKINIPKAPRQRKANVFGLPAGGSGGAGLLTGKTGKWYVKKHKVKTPAQMLKTFGVNVGGGRTQGFKAPNIKMAGLSSKQTFKAPNMKIGGLGKTPSFKAPDFNTGGFSTKQFDKMFQQPKQKRRR